MQCKRCEIEEATPTQGPDAILQFAAQPNGARISERETPRTPSHAQLAHGV